MVPHPALGYAMVALAATLFAINGTVSKVILASGIDSRELTEVRCAGALLGLTLIAAATRPASLRISRRELPLLVALGVGGLALVQWSYFVAIHRVEIGIALVVQFVGPILVALWARLVYGEEVRSRIWVALALALTGLVLMVQIWDADRPDALGLAAATLAADTYAAYILLAERGVRRRDPISLSAWGFLFATLFWSLLAPWWNFPGDSVAGEVPPGSEEGPEQRREQKAPGGERDRIAPADTALCEQDVRRVGVCRQSCCRQAQSVRPVRIPDLHHQHEAGQCECERDPDARAHLFAVDQARPEGDEDRSDELDHERDADLDAMDGDEVRPLHEGEPADAECDQQWELTPADAQRRRPRGRCDQRQAEECACAPDLRQLPRVDPRGEDHLRHRAVDREQRRRKRDHRVAERGVRDHRADLTDVRCS